MVQIVEERKSHSVGGGDENSVKNRSESVIPFDRNRVILTPIPSREHSTYINASFIEVNTTLSTIGCAKTVLPTYCNNEELSSPLWRVLLILSTFWHSWRVSASTPRIGIVKGKSRSWILPYCVTLYFEGHEKTKEMVR